MFKLPKFLAPYILVNIYDNVIIFESVDGKKFGGKFCI